MLDIGFSEILVITGLSLVVLGPDKLPQVARTIGRWAGRARAMARQFRDQLEAEADSLKVNLNEPPPSTPSASPPPASPPPAPAPPTSTPSASATPPAAPAPAAPAVDTPMPTEDHAPHDRRE